MNFIEEFADLLKTLIEDWNAAGKSTESEADEVIRIIALSLCEIDPEFGPSLDSPELHDFVFGHEDEIGSASKPLFAMLKQTMIVH
ncbi:MAG: hypothetical protein JWO71_2488 [Candidatus Acidoferrum typicum]|nr:hypothetical protein [Candidatus Acidoferrum typicum]